MTVLLLVGPTAVGKTGVSLRVARQARAEIISADARAVYRGLQIGTDRPSDEALRSVPHHLIGMLDLREAYDAAQFRRDCEKLVADIHGRGRRAMVVGGSTLYVRALTKGLFEGPSADWEFRRSLSGRSSPELYGELKEVDPAAAARIAPSDRVRIVRALEVYRNAGRPISALWGQQQPAPWPIAGVGLTVDREELHRRIETRVDRMLEEGLLEEARALQAEFLPPEAPAARTIGYRELFAYLRGEVDLDEARRRIVAGTKAYARRQLSWFRGDELHWIDVTGRDQGDVAGEVLAVWEEADRRLECEL
ncbi:MAG: tRNA (adenosine(37)-N6)-dimethylallyltransferase MiaA [Candidatus Bipolaricaulota bacterium]